MECPNCQSDQITLITYGAPPLQGAQLTKAIEDKAIVMGGCLMCEAEAPAFYCRACGHKFGDAREKPKRRKWFSK